MNDAERRKLAKSLSDCLKRHEDSCWERKYNSVVAQLGEMRDELEETREELQQAQEDLQDEPPDRQVYQSLRNEGRLLEVKRNESIVETPDGLLIVPAQSAPLPLVTERDEWRQAALEARRLVQQIYDRDWMKSAQPWHLIAEKHPWLREHELGEELET